MRVGTAVAWCWGHRRSNFTSTARASIGARGCPRGLYPSTVTGCGPRRCGEVAADGVVGGEVGGTGALGGCLVGVSCPAQ